MTYRARQHCLPPSDPCCWFDGANLNFASFGSIRCKRSELPVGSNWVRWKEILYRRWVLTQIQERITSLLPIYRTDEKRMGTTNESSVIARTLDQIRDNPFQKRS